MHTTISNRTVGLIAIVYLLLFAAAYLLIVRPDTGSDVALVVPPLATTSDATATPATPKPSATGTKQPAASQPQQSQAPAAKTAGVGTLNDIAAFKTPTRCIVETTDAPDRSGTAYVSSGELRVNLTDGVTMIRTGGYYYAWLAGNTTGLKLLASSSVSGSALALRGGIDPNARISFSCYAWTPSASIFVPPAAVTFTDRSGM